MTDDEPRGNALLFRSSPKCFSTLVSSKETLYTREWHHSLQLEGFKRADGLQSTALPP